MEASSLAKFDVFALSNSVTFVVLNFAQLVFSYRFKVDLWEFNDDLQGHKVDQTIRDCLLVGQDENVHELATDCGDHLNETQQECDISAWVFKLVSLLVGEFHDAHTSRHLWRKHEV